jgi:hypothetical protein
LVVAISVIVFNSLMDALLDDILQAASAPISAWSDLVHDKGLCPVDDVLLGVPHFRAIRHDGLEDDSLAGVPGE